MFALAVLPVRILLRPMSHLFASSSAILFGVSTEESKEDIIELLTQCERDLKLAEEVSVA